MMGNALSVAGTRTPFFLFQILLVPRKRSDKETSNYEKGLAS